MEVNVVGVFPVFGVAQLAEHLMAHGLGEADDLIQRRAQLVAHMGQELAFRLVGVFGVLQSLPELLFRRQALADLVVEVRILALDDFVGAPNDDEENAVKQAKGPHQADGKPFHVRW